MIYVAAGGALGAVFRYGLSSIKWQAGFPWMTLLINIIGAFVIGVVIHLVGNEALSKEGELFLKVGLCGGFTTFSTFSLESLQLLEQGRWLTGGLYIMASIVLTLVAVWIGKSVMQWV